MKDFDDDLLGLYSAGIMTLEAVLRECMKRDVRMFILLGRIRQMKPLAGYTYRRRIANYKSDWDIVRIYIDVYRGKKLAGNLVFSRFSGFESANMYSYPESEVLFQAIYDSIFLKQEISDAEINAARDEVIQNWGVTQ